MGPSVDPAHDAFLRAVLADPDDDAPRLVYADWLEERGDPRGEFIRLQCAAAALPAGDPRATRLLGRARKLLERHFRAWLGGLRSWMGPCHLDRAGYVVEEETPGPDLGPATTRVKCRFRRGFVEEVRIGGGAAVARFAAAAPAVFAAAPVRRLAFHPDYTCSTGYHVHGPLDVAPLAGLSELIRLDTLELVGCGITPAGFAALAGSPHLARLELLNLRGTPIGSVGLAALGGAPLADRLTTLKLEGDALRDPEDRIWPSWRPFVIGPAVGALARTRLPARLRGLGLSHGEIGDRGASALAGSPYLAGLVALDLSDNRIGDAGARALAGSPSLERLTKLDLFGNVFSPAAARLLRDRFGDRVTL